MKRELKREKLLIFHIVDGVRIDGPPPGVRGDLTDVRGDLTGVRGNLTDVWGNLTDVYGDLDACGITDEDRERGIDIRDLIED